MAPRRKISRRAANPEPFSCSPRVSGHARHFCGAQFGVLKKKKCVRLNSFFIFIFLYDFCYFFREPIGGPARRDLSKSVEKSEFGQRTKKLWRVRLVQKTSRWRAAAAPMAAAPGWQPPHAMGVAREYFGLVMARSGSRERRLEECLKNTVCF